MYQKLEELYFTVFTFLTYYVVKLLIIRLGWTMSRCRAMLYADGFRANLLTVLEGYEASHAHGANERMA